VIAGAIDRGENELHRPPGYGAGLDGETAGRANMAVHSSWMQILAVGDSRVRSRG